MTITKDMQLKGIHHVTAMTDDGIRNYEFFTDVLGMRLIKKTVNQDDIHTYHTFYSDDEGNPGTDMTFFDFPNIPKGTHGTNEISRVGFRVPSDEALEYYKKRFEEFDVKHGEIEEFLGGKVLDFEESDGQLYRIYSDENNEGVPAGKGWKNGPVPEEFAINALGPVEITVSYFDDFKNVLETLYGLELIVDEKDLAVYEMGDGGNGARVILRRDEDSGSSIQGYGIVHHMALRVEDKKAIDLWLERYEKFGVLNSGYINRFFFGALYARIGHILIEISTEGPGFLQDESYETAGEILSLPPMLEAKRDLIEKQVKPFDTSDVNTKHKK